MKIKFRFIYAGFLFVPVFFSCRPNGTVASIQENALFSLNYGNFEDEINLFNLSQSGSINTFMAMEEGFFYIANGESKKIMELNSYGDILTLYYNEDYSMPPSFARSSGVNSTKKAVAYPFNSLGPLAVDSNKCLYAVDTLPQERQEVDVENRLLLNYIVLRFDSNGTFIDYLGQQGPGGTPFPYIKNIYATSSNELVVVSESNSGPVVYWFNSKGFLLYKIPFTSSLVPKLKDSDENDSFVSIHSIIPDSINRRLFVQVDYFQNYLDPATKVLSGIEFEKTVLYPLDVDTGVYDAGLEIPCYEESISENLGKVIYRIPYDFLGVTDGGWLFFILPVEKGYLVQMVQPNGQKVLKRVLPVNHEDILYYSLCLSGKGIISGLFVKKEQAQVLWWRTDYLVGGLVN